MHIKQYCFYYLLMYKTFVIHSSDLSDRDKKVDEIKECFNDVVVVSQFKASDVTDDALRSIKIEATNNPNYDTNITRMTKPEYSICMNHIAAIEEAIKTGFEGPFLFLEDDCMYNSDIIEKITPDIKQFQDSDFDIMYMNVAGNNTDVIQSINLETTIIPVSNAYMLKSSALKDILVFLKQEIKYSYPRLLAYAGMMSKKKACLSTDQHIIDGSKYGAFLSLVSDNSILPINPTWSKIYAYINQNPDKRDMGIEENLSMVPENSHPAMQILKGMYLSVCKGEHEAAKEVYDNVNKSFQEKNITMNGSTLFMKKYAELFQHLQSS